MVIDLIESVSSRALGNFGGAKLTSMDAENLVVDDNTQREKVEHVCKVVPHIGIPIFS